MSSSESFRSPQDAAIKDTAAQGAEAADASELKRVLMGDKRETLPLHVHREEGNEPVASCAARILEAEQALDETAPAAEGHTSQAAIAAATKTTSSLNHASAAEVTPRHAEVAAAEPTDFPLSLHPGQADDTGDIKHADDKSAAETVVTAKLLADEIAPPPRPAANAPPRPHHPHRPKSSRAASSAPLVTSAELAATGAVRSLFGPCFTGAGVTPRSLALTRTDSGVTGYGIEPIASDERLLGAWSCALSLKILIQGKLYLFEQHLGFYSNLFAYETKKLVQLKDVTAIRLCPNMLPISSLEVELTASGRSPPGRSGAVSAAQLHRKLVFASLNTRDDTLRALLAAWGDCQRTGPRRKPQPGEEAEMEERVISLSDSGSAGGFSSEGNSSGSDEDVEAKPAVNAIEPKPAAPPPEKSAAARGLEDLGKELQVAYGIAGRFLTDPAKFVADQQRGARERAAADKERDGGGAMGPRPVGGPAAGSKGQASTRGAAKAAVSPPESVAAAAAAGSVAGVASLAAAVVANASGGSGGGLSSASSASTARSSLHEPATAPDPDWADLPPMAAPPPLGAPLITDELSCSVEDVVAHFLADDASFLRFWRSGRADKDIKVSAWRPEPGGHPGHAAGSGPPQRRSVTFITPVAASNGRFASFAAAAMPKEARVHEEQRLRREDRGGRRGRMSSGEHSRTRAVILESSMTMPGIPYGSSFSVFTIIVFTAAARRSRGGAAGDGDRCTVAVHSEVVFTSFVPFKSIIVESTTTQTVAAYRGMLDQMTSRLTVTAGGAMPPPPPPNRPESLPPAAAPAAPSAARLVCSAVLASIGGPRGLAATYAGCVLVLFHAVLIAWLLGLFRPAGHHVIHAGLMAPPGWGGGAAAAAAARRELLGLQRTARLLSDKVAALAESVAHALQSLAAATD